MGIKPFPCDLNHIKSRSAMKLRYSIPYGHASGSENIFCQKILFPTERLKEHWPAFLGESQFEFLINHNRGLFYHNSNIASYECCKTYLHFDIFFSSRNMYFSICFFVFILRGAYSTMFTI